MGDRETKTEGEGGRERVRERESRRRLLLLENDNGASSSRRTVRPLAGLLPLFAFSACYRNWIDLATIALNRHY